MLKSNQLPKDFKLKSPQSFQRVYKGAKKFRCHGISLLSCRNELACSRIGISVPKKQIRRAVDRNRIKRIIREYFRIQKNELQTNLDIVFVVFCALQDLPNHEITACLKVLWQKLIRSCEEVPS